MAVPQSGSLADSATEAVLMHYGDFAWVTSDGVLIVGDWGNQEIRFGTAIER
jgi:hypothetical protein